MRIGQIEDRIFEQARDNKVSGFCFDSKDRYSCKIDGVQTIIVAGKNRKDAARKLLDLWSNAADLTADQRQAAKDLRTKL